MSNESIRKSLGISDLSAVQKKTNHPIKRKVSLVWFQECLGPRDRRGQWSKFNWLKTSVNYGQQFNADFYSYS